MAYIGKTPTLAPLTSSDIADGIISTSKLADTSVTNAKINADLISAETELATSPADTDEFLISDAGVLKRIDASLVGGGGAFKKLDTITISGNTSQIEHEEANFTSTYKDYRMVLSGLTVTSDASMYMRVAGDGASLLSANNYQYGMVSYRHTGAYQRNYSTGGSQIHIGGTSTGTGGSYTTDLIIDIFDPLNTSTYFRMSVFGQINDDNNYQMATYGAGRYVAADSTAMKRFVLYMASGDFNNGTSTLYGRVA
jgi:hypothetical protein